MKLKNKRRMAQVAAFAISNLGLLRVLKTGFVCPFLYCHGCPFSLFGCPIGVIQNFIVEGRFPFFTLGSLGVYGTILGRSFCGWACPFGTLHDILSHTNRRREVKTPNHWYVKYAILSLTLIAVWLASDTVFCKLCPSGSLFAAFPFLLIHPGFEQFGPPFYVHVLTLVLTIFLAVLISRFWCRYLCPLGAIAGAFNKVSMLTIRWDQEGCTRCNACLDVCVMGVTNIEGIGSSTECILCGRCVEECPERTLSFKIGKRS